MPKDYYLLVNAKKIIGNIKYMYYNDAKFCNKLSSSNLTLEVYMVRVLSDKSWYKVYKETFREFKKTMKVSIKLALRKIKELSKENNVICSL